MIFVYVDKTISHAKNTHTHWVRERETNTLWKVAYLCVGNKRKRTALSQAQTQTAPRTHTSTNSISPSLSLILLFAIMRGLFHHSFTHFSRCAKQYHNARTYTNIFYEHGEQPACQCLRVRKAAPLNKCEQASKRMNVPLRLCLTKRIFLQNENENQEEPNTSIRKASKQKSVILEAIKISESNSSFIAPKRKPTKRQSQNLTEFKNEIRLKRLHKAHTKKNKQTNSHTCTSSQRFAQTHTHIHTHRDAITQSGG